MTAKVLIAIQVRASPERAFEAFTREIGLWWRPNALFRFTPRSPGALSFEPGEEGRLVETLPNGTVFEVGRIRVWEPGSRLVVGWRCAWFEPGQDTELEVRFEPRGEETRVVVEHRGWDVVPAENAARHGFPPGAFLSREAEWWRAMAPGYAARAAGPASPAA